MLQGFLICSGIKPVRELQHQTKPARAMKLVIEVGASVYKLADCLGSKVIELFELFELLINRLRPGKPCIYGGKIMYVVKADTPNQRYEIVPPDSVTDSEGHRVNPETLDYEILSDNEGAIKLVPDDDNDPMRGTIEIGGPAEDGTAALANVNVLVSYKGTVLGSYGAQFTVTAGDPAAITGGGLRFPGLSEEPAPEEPSEEEDEETGGTGEGGSLPSEGESGSFGNGSVTPPGV